MVGEPCLGPVPVLVHDSWCPACGDAGVFHLACAISDFSPGHARDSPQAQALGNTQAATAMAAALRRAEAREDGISIAGVLTTGGGQMSPQHQGRGGGGSGGGGGGSKNDRGAADKDVTDVAAGGGGSQHYMWREVQIKQFVYLIISREGKRRWVMNNYIFKDVHDPTMAAAVADGKEDNGKNNSNDYDDRQTPSAWSNLIVRICFLTLLLLF